MRQRKDSLFPTNGKVSGKRYFNYIATPSHKQSYAAYSCSAKNSQDNLNSVNKARYDAWEEDIAVVNIFFGKETVIGHFSHLQHHLK